MKCPGEFRFRGIYMSAEPDASRMVVLLVHGANGSPRDFVEVAKHLDLSKYQAWFAYYATGDPVAASSDAIAADVRALMDEHGILPRRDRPQLGRHRRMAGPGEARPPFPRLSPGQCQHTLGRQLRCAARNVAVALTASDVVRSCARQQGLAADQEQPHRPAFRPRLHSHTGRPRASGDGIISLRSQLHAGMRQRAFSIVKEIGTHDSVLCDEAAKQRSD
jgi:hypothetical protein